MSTQTRKRRKHEEIDDKEVIDNEDNGEVSEDEDSEDIEEDIDSDDNEDKELINKVFIDLFIIWLKCYKFWIFYFNWKSVDIDFGAYQPSNDDFNGIKCLLSQLWLKEKINISELTQLLIEQNFICSVIKVFIKVLFKLNFFKLMLNKN